MSTSAASTNSGSLTLWFGIINYNPAIKLKVRVYSLCILSLLLYSSEKWSICRSHESCLNLFIFKLVSHGGILPLTAPSSMPPVPMTSLQLWGTDFYQWLGKWPHLPNGHNVSYRFWQLTVGGYAEADQIHIISNLATDIFIVGAKWTQKWGKWPIKHYQVLIHPISIVMQLPTEVIHSLNLHEQITSWRKLPVQGQNWEA